MATTHIIGAGLSGLAAAVALSKRGEHLILYEASGQAGGRCRSYHDDVLGCEVDNGNHLLLAANDHARAFIREIGAANHWIQVKTGYRFVDHATNRTWSWKWPIWLPCAPVTEFFYLFRLWYKDTINQAIPHGSTLGERWATPLSVSALNTQPHKASARLFRQMLIDIAKRGPSAASPYLATAPFHRALITPALNYLSDAGITQHYHTRIRSLLTAQGAITGLLLADKTITVGPKDQVILASPAWEAARLLPGLRVPDEHEAIINIHFRYDHKLEEDSIYGISGGLVDWVFVKKNAILSTTTSAANHQVPDDKEALVARAWTEVVRRLGLRDTTTPPHRLLVEKRATFKATPQQCARRPDSETHYSNLWLAGDYTNTGLPASIEGAIRSGERAAELAIKAR